MSVGREERFWSKVQRADVGCWEWERALATNGYAQFWNGERLVAAHRYAYELEVGPIPEGLVLDHLCRVPTCVRPDHLEPVTMAENTRRGFSAREVCRRGHPFDGDNVRHLKNGSRRCRECARIWQRGARRVA